ncbi:hypothetical protein E2C01_059934 [Portunus trituberculatus]|uniref:Uncharacterized protein n=1 Tax=Portunus trituberculatus TaxID=210409 RepID=A0A5B7H942_PORTR|nr:hypothetical protein [Portunus trituberculatus]
MENSEDSRARAQEQVVTAGSGRDDGKDLREHVRRQLTYSVVELGETAGDLGSLKLHSSRENQRQVLRAERWSSESNRRSCATIRGSHGDDS